MSSPPKPFIPALGYNWLTGFYDLTVKLTMPEKEFRAKLIDELDPQDDEAILEFGYGTGQNMILAHQRNDKAKLTGVDIDPKVREIAKHKLQQQGIDITLDLYDGGTFKYADNTFDKVFSSLVFHQLDKATKLRCLKEINRVLKPGGQLVIGDWGKAQNKTMRFAFYFVQLLDGFETTSDNVNGLMPGFMEEAGFRKVRETGVINTKIGTYSYYRAEK